MHASMQRMATFQDGVVRVLDLLELSLSQLLLVDGALVRVPRLTQLPVKRQAHTHQSTNVGTHAHWDSCTGAWPHPVPHLNVSLTCES